MCYNCNYFLSFNMFYGSCLVHGVDAHPNMVKSIDNCDCYQKRIELMYSSNTGGHYENN